MREFVGDQIFAVFNKAGDQPDHALRAAGAGLALQRAAAEIAAGHPDWPSFRVGVNTGEVLAGVVGERGHRIHGVFGDTVNLGARLEGQAPPGGVVIGERDARAAAGRRRRRGAAGAAGQRQGGARHRLPPQSIALSLGGLSGRLDAEERLVEHARLVDGDDEERRRSCVPEAVRRLGRHDQDRFGRRSTTASPAVQRPSPSSSRNVST